MWYKENVDTKKKVFVGVSGGVDSSVALALLQKEGYDVTGVFLKTWYPEWMQCDWKEERRSAMRVCATLGLPFLTLDYEKEYKKEVVDYMLREYSEGRVPNPDVFCNKYVKFGVFLQKALELGADYVATGHYARTSFDSYLVRSTKYFRAGNFLALAPSRSESLRPRHESAKSFQLLESVDKEKDQSYFLYTLGQKELKHILFPIGGMTKPEVRKLAEKFDLPTAHKKDSQGLCFLGKVDMKDFLSHYIETKTGDVLNTNGEVIGTHQGALLYAIGERHGFEIAKKSPNDPRYFVVAKDLSKNTIIVADKEKEADTVYSVKEIIIKNLHLINLDDTSSKLNKPLKTYARIRYRQEKQPCVLEKKSGWYRIVFDVPQSGVSIGQSAVLYDGEICLGGGIIEEVR